MTMKTTETSEQQAPAPVQCSDLLACPFCGGPATIEETELLGDVRKSAGCNTEYCQGYQSTQTFSTRREAIAAWNCRAYDASIGAKWKANSSLEEWFPFSAQKLKTCEAELGRAATTAVKLGQLSKHWREASADYRKRAREWAVGDPMHEARSQVADMLENCANVLDATVQANSD